MSMNHFQFVRGSWHKGFTLIELLIVVAIIAILAAIAVPNFLEAQTRSKVSRAKSDMRAVATALESYMVDANTYPLWATESTIRMAVKASAAQPFIGYTPKSLTSPIAYMTSLPKDPFDCITPPTSVNYNANPLRLLAYDAEKNFNIYHNSNYWNNVGSQNLKWIMASVGPSRQTHIPNAYGPTNNLVEAFQFDEQVQGVNFYYDPSNGTVSYGNIILSGPGGGFDYRKSSNYTR